VPYSIAVVDIDHFKSFNDLYGHDAGDEVLRMVAGRLAQVSGGGQAFRCGGEEFAIVFRGRRAAEALPCLEELRREIEKCTFRLRGPDRRQQIRGPDRRGEASRPQRPRKGKTKPPAPCDITSVSVSIGVAEPEVEQRTVQLVMAAADKALYRAKAAGRNRVEMAGAQALPQGKLAAASRD
jgi:PleD family two-component response regulator